MNGIIENFEKSQIGFREENSELQKDLETQKDIQEKNLLALKFELQSKEAQQQSLIKETEETKEKYERIIKQLEEESCYKMKIFHENTEKRVEFYIEKTKEDYSLFSKYFGENIQSYFDNVKQNVEIFSAQIENKTENILKKPKEIVKESEMKQSGLKEESKEKNNTPIKKVAVLN